MLASLLTHCGDDVEVEVHILDDGVSSANRERLASLSSICPFRLSFHSLSALPVPLGPATKDWPLTLYQRLRLPSLLPDLDRVLFLDADMIVLEDLAEVFETPLNGAWLAAVPDARSLHNRQRLNLKTEYVNFGLQVIDLKALREYQAENLLLQTLEQRCNDLKYMDQDVLNIALAGHIAILPLRWNSQFIDDRYSSRQTEHFKHPAVIHYVTNEKPWLPLSSIPRRDYYRHYLAMTPWFDEWKQQVSRELKTWKPWKRYLRRFFRQEFQFHLIDKGRGRYVRILGITFLRDQQAEN